MALAKTIVLNEPTKPDYWAVPSAVFSNPELASVVSLMRAALKLCGAGMYLEPRPACNTHGCSCGTHCLYPIASVKSTHCAVNPNHAHVTVPGRV